MSHKLRPKKFDRSTLPHGREYEGVVAKGIIKVTTYVITKRVGGATPLPALGH